MRMRSEKTYHIKKRFVLFVTLLLCMTVTLTLAAENIISVKGLEDGSKAESTYNLEDLSGGGIESRTIEFSTIIYPSLNQSTFLGEYSVFCHCACETCTGRRNGEGEITEVGSIATEGITVAVDPEIIPYGTKLYIEGLGTFIAQDYLPNTTGHTISVYIGGYEHLRARSMGIKVLQVYEVK